MSISARAFAEKTGISYPTVLALLHKGSFPRKSEHRESLRRELNLTQEDWAAVLASSQRDGIDIPRQGPLTLRQLVLKTLLAQGFTEQSFAKVSGVPYATLMGLTRKGAIPRADTLSVIADKLGLSQSDVDEAAMRSRAERLAEGLEPASEVMLLVDEPAMAGINGVAAEVETEQEPPYLAQLVANRIAEDGISVAAFAHSHRIPYISLCNLLLSGIPPSRASVLEPLSRALGLSEEDFARSLHRSEATPTPASQPPDEAALTPLQEALRSLVKAKNLTTKAFAEMADLSVLTATKLLKHGDLPGRTSTHEKLRSLLQLSQADYDHLVRRSRSESAAALHGTAEAPAGEGPSVEELLLLIQRLGPRQRAAVKHYIAELR